MGQFSEEKYLKKKKILNYTKHHRDVLILTIHIKFNNQDLFLSFVTINIYIYMYVCV